MSHFVLGLGSSLGRRRRRRAAGLGASRKSCLNSKGKLKPGYKFGKGGRCVRAKKR
jgi:hypothetical protein